MESLADALLFRAIRFAENAVAQDLPRPVQHEVRAVLSQQVFVSRALRPLLVPNAPVRSWGDPVFFCQTIVQKKEKD